MTVLRPLLFSLWGFLFLACQSEPDMASYYLPLDALEGGLCYRYESLDAPPFDDEVWQHRVVNRGSGQVLISTSIDSGGLVSQKIIETITELGVLTDSVFLNIPDSLGNPLTVPVDVIDRATFPFYNRPEEKLNYKIRWVDPRDSLEYTLSRSRQWLQDTVVYFEGSEHAAKVFALTESLETFWVHDGTTNSSWPGIEIYAEGLGLYYYKKQISPTYERTFRLKERQNDCR